MKHKINTQAKQVIQKPFSFSSLKYLAKASVNPLMFAALLTAE